MFCRHRKHAIVDYVTQSPNLSEHKFHAGSRRQASHDDLMGGGDFHAPSGPGNSGARARRRLRDSTAALARELLNPAGALHVCAARATSDHPLLGSARGSSPFWLPLPVLSKRRREACGAGAAVAERRPRSRACLGAEVAQGRVLPQCGSCFFATRTPFRTVTLVQFALLYTVWGGMLCLSAPRAAAQVAMTCCAACGWAWCPLSPPGFG